MPEIIDLLRLRQYKENNRIEAKRSLGGLPKSLWETYSAFANTLGGVILLGVEEYRDKSLHPIDLPAPELLIDEFWTTLNDPRFVNINLLSANDVATVEVDGKRIIIITVPRAPHYLKPVYLEGNPLTGTYVRNGEGDYRCSPEEVKAMLESAAVHTSDMRVLDQFDQDFFLPTTLHDYRQRVNKLRPGHIWAALDDHEFLYKIGALGRQTDGSIHPTVGGLIMFGRHNDIIKVCPNFHLEYQEFTPASGHLAFHIDSNSQSWSGNLHDFYFNVIERLISGIHIPEERDIESDFTDTPVHKAMREALSNCLVNGDYYNEDGITIIKHDELLTLSSPGGFNLDSSKGNHNHLGATNECLLQIFNLAGVAERASNGLPTIFAAWRHEGWELPTMVMLSNPPRLSISLAIKPISSNPFKKKNILPKKQVKELIIAHLTTDITVEISDLVRTLGISGKQARLILNEMEDEGTVVTTYGFLTKYYKLKA